MVKKKQLLIVANGLSTNGGIGNVLNHMLRYICNAMPEYEIDLLLSDIESARNMSNELDIHVLPIQYSFPIEVPTREMIKMVCKGDRAGSAINFILDRQLCKLGYHLPLMNDTAASVKKIKKHYDVAIAYNVIPSFITTFVALYVDADRKIAWSHSDITQDVKREHGISSANSSLIIKNLASYRHTLDIFDKIYAVSKGVKQSLIREIGVRNTQIDVFYNFANREEIINKSLANVDVSLKSGEIMLLTVGRLSHEKGIMRTLEVARKLKESGYNYKWYLLGYIIEKKEIEAYINKYNLSDNIVMTGNVANPYPYYRMCDIYIHCSNVEGYCTATNEARMLGKPVVTTDVAGAEEQIINGVNGFIVNKTAEEVFDAVKQLIEDKTLREKFGKYNEELQFDNKESEYLLKELLKC